MEADAAALIRKLVVVAPALLASLSVHEFAHAWIATRLGDSTPRSEGRLTLSPLSHIDPFGTIIFPLLLLALTPSVFGWARPVRFQPANFTRKLTMWQGAALTAIAGPFSNLLLAVLSGLAIRLAISFGADPSGFGLRFAVTMLNLNVLLAIFNLVPLPPLDGGYLIPRSLDAVRAFLVRYSSILFLGLFLIPLPGLGAPLGSYIISPITEALRIVILRVMSLA